MPTRTATIIFRIDSAGYLRELDKVERKTREAANATTSLEKSSARANRQSATLTKQHRQQAREAGVLSSALRSAGAALGVFVAIDLLRRLGRMALEFTRIAARITTVRLAFETLTRQEGIDPATFFREIQQAAGGALGAIDSYLIGNRALLANNEELVRRLPEVVKATRAVAAATGIEYVQAIRDLTTGIIKLEPEILDNLGLNVKLEQTNRQAAAALGIATSALTFQQKEAAFTAEAIRQLTERAAKLGDIQNPQVTETGKLAAAYEKLSASIGMLTQSNVIGFLQRLTRATEALDRAIQSITPTRDARSLLAVASGTTLQEAEGQRADIERRQRVAAGRSIAAQGTLARIDPGQAFFSERLARERDLAERTVNIERAKLIVLGKQLEVINKYIAVKEQELRVTEATEATEADQARIRAAAVVAERNKTIMIKAQNDALVNQLKVAKDLADLVESLAVLFAQNTGNINKSLFAGSVASGVAGGVGGVGIRGGAGVGVGGAGFFGGSALTGDLSRVARQDGTRATEEQRKATEAARKSAEATRQANQELLLFVSSLENLSPTLGGLARTAVNIRSSIALLSNPSTGALGQLSGAFGIAGAAISAVSIVSDVLGSVFGKAERNAEALQRAETALLNIRRQQIQEAVNTLQSRVSQNLADIEFREFRENVQLSIGQVLAGAFQNTSFAEFLPGPGTNLNELTNERVNQILLDAARYAGQNSELRSIVQEVQREIIQRQRSIAQAEIEVRREQAQLIIKEIERQRREVLDHIRNAEEAQRQATTRAVSLTFDLLEADLRTQYTRQFVQAGSSPSAREATRENLFRDIETLRGGESQTLTRELDNISQIFNQRRDEAAAHFDALQMGVELAISDLSLDFDTALQTHVTAELMKLNEAQPTFLEALKQIAPNFATQWTDTIQPGIDEFTKTFVVTPITTEIATLSTALSTLTLPTPQVVVNTGETLVTVNVDQAGNVTEGTTKDDDVIIENPTPTGPVPSLAGQLGGLVAQNYNAFGPGRFRSNPSSPQPRRTVKPTVPQPKPFNPATL